MTDITETVDAYLAMWNEPDRDRRAGHIARAWTADARYADPLLEADGHDALSVMVDGVHARFPGHRFRRASGIDRHHDVARFGWELVAPDGTVAVAGIDVADLDTTGRLRRVAGFFGELPTEATA